jgi:hypothetical protein
MADETAVTRERAAPRSNFDLAARLRLRGRLLRYMEEHGIGSPALQSRIAKSAGRSSDLIPLKTLQRFLGGDGRTNDGMLALIAGFADKLPDENRAEEFAAASALFFSGGPAGAAADSGGLIGAYSIFESQPAAAQIERKGLKTYAKGESPVEYTKPHASCVIDRAETDGPLLMRQKLFEDEAPPGGASAPRRLEGVLLFFDPVILVIAKDVATRLPCTYWLRPVADGMFGDGVEAAFVTGPAELRPYRRGAYLFQRTV